MMGKDHGGRNCCRSILGQQAVQRCGRGVLPTSCRRGYGNHEKKTTPLKTNIQPKNEVCKMIILSKRFIFRFQASFQGRFVIIYFTKHLLRYIEIWRSQSHIAINLRWFSSSGINYRNSTMTKAKQKNMKGSPLLHNTPFPHEKSMRSHRFESPFDQL